MRLLLDTHTLLWSLREDEKLAPAVRQLIQDSNNVLLISPASFWELAIKVSLGKLDLRIPVVELMREATTVLGAIILPIEPKHIAPLETMEFHHRDPFDRILIAQAMVEGIGLVSADKVFDAYGVSRVW